MQIHFADEVILQIMFSGSAEEYPSNDFQSLILTSFMLYTVTFLHISIFHSYSISFPTLTKDFRTQLENSACPIQFLDSLLKPIYGDILQESAKVSFHFANKMGPLPPPEPQKQLSRNDWFNAIMMTVNVLLLPEMMMSEKVVGFCQKNGTFFISVAHKVTFPSYQI